MTDRISGGAFKQMVAFGAACIAQQKQTINDLNVFPVPDGDTGTNMCLTIQTAVNELRKNQPATVEEAAKITASGLLRGARGNSGVILSLLFRGMSKALKGVAEADGAQLAAAMQEGVATAYGAVMKPAEGTVLTVSRLAAQRALEAAGERNDADYVLEEADRLCHTGGDHGDESGAEEGRRGRCRRQGLPHYFRGHASCPAGRGDPRGGGAGRGEGGLCRHRR